MINKKAQGGVIAFGILFVVLLLISWFVFVTVWPIAAPFIAVLNADPITMFFLYLIPIFLVLSIPLIILFRGGM